MEKERCSWCRGNELYEKYHDEEWGVPVWDDYKQFEFLVLESAQAGLSWITVLKKRENYRKAYLNFDFEQVAAFDEKKVEEMLLDAGLIRNRAKIEASINNAKHFIKIRQEHGSFCNYLWAFVGNQPINNSFATLSEVPAVTPLSDAIAKDLKKRGFKFLGSTVIYAHLQATGLVNDHITTCFRYKEIIE
ncbi:MAG: DNA-3-methyladenine glycosylase I [Chitinophagales bacterium]|nr:DNA-3-methyladenine glycosylase I [Chitinophagales bacterium]